MAHRYCPDHDDGDGAWLETRDYTVSKAGETMCPEHERPVIGFIAPGPRIKESDCRFPNATARRQALEEGLIDG